ncbi:MAG TPA: ribose 5-phosphate isomerase B [Anaerolineales bacterium]|nr:ribose 5-phosphate isomerase B [Anaerolineales bacterium]
MKIIMGSDHYGYSLKEDLKAYLEELGHEPVDLGCHGAAEPVDYPDVAVEVAEKIARGEYARGILICGTGIGMAIVANKIPGVRAACCHDPYSAERARKSNDAQILTMGAQIVGPALGRQLLDHWLASEFAGGRSTSKVEKIKKLDQRFRAQPDAPQP